MLLLLRLCHLSLLSYLTRVRITIVNCLFPDDVIILIGHIRVLVFLGEDLGDVERGLGLLHNDQLLNTVDFRRELLGAPIEDLEVAVNLNCWSPGIFWLPTTT